MRSGSGFARIAWRALSRDDGHVQQGTGPAPRRTEPREGDPWRPWQAPRQDSSEVPAAQRRPGSRHYRRFGRWRTGPRTSGPLRRGREDRLAGGGADRVSARPGFGVTPVRTPFWGAALGTGLGAAAYVA